MGKWKLAIFTVSLLIFGRKTQNYESITISMNSVELKNIKGCNYKNNGKFSGKSIQESSSQKP